MRPIALDLFCGAGGAGFGLQQAGFDVVGVDIAKQPHYPYTFVQEDAIIFLNEHYKDFNYIHASPPCQAYSKMTKGLWKDRVKTHPSLIEELRVVLNKTGLPYDIENVEGAPLINPIMLCGTMFGLRANVGSQLRRHRFFETNWYVGSIPKCNHDRFVKARFTPDGKRIPRTIGVWGHTGGGSKRDNYKQFTVADWSDAMDIDWMTANELREAIPPAYTRFLGVRWMTNQNKINQ